MHRIDGEGHVNNHPTEGNPQTGQPATVLTAEWGDAIQEEIAHAIEFAGFVLNKLDNTQLRQAIIALISGVIGSGGGAVPTTRQVLGGGMVTGGGPLAADLTLSVAKATSAEIGAGVLDTAAITPLGLFTAFAGTADVAVLPGGWKLMKGQILGTYGEGAVLATLPASFTSATYAVAITTINAGGALAKDVIGQRVSKTLSTFTAFMQAADGLHTIDGFEYIAFGK